MKSKAVRIDRHGGPEELKIVEVEVGEPGPGEIRIRHKAVGLNFIDTYQRSGLYPFQMPLQLGMEASGVVEAVGEGVTHLKAGDRAAYASQPPGAYSELRVMPAKNVCRLPDDISFETGAAMMLKGLTTQYLLKKTLPAEGLQAGDFIVFHAAAGGVGLLFGQWAKARGYKVIGTVSSPEKAALAKKHGYKWVIDYTKQNIVEEVMKITKGKKVPAVVDGVGKDTWEASLDCLQPRGIMASFGNASGPVPPQSIAILNAKGSLYLTRPSLGAYTSTRKDLEASANSLFKMVKSGKVKIAIDQRYPLAEAGQAHADLESRKTTGQTILIP